MLYNTADRSETLERTKFLMGIDEEEKEEEEVLAALWVMIVKGV